MKKLLYMLLLTAVLAVSAGCMTRLDQTSGDVIVFDGDIEYAIITIYEDIWEKEADEPVSYEYDFGDEGWLQYIEAWLSGVEFNIITPVDMKVDFYLGINDETYYFGFVDDGLIVKTPDEQFFKALNADYAEDEYFFPLFSLREFIGEMRLSYYYAQFLPQYEQITLEFIELLNQNPELESLLVRSIEIAAEINPDRATNPAQNLEEFFNFLDWSVRAMPWNVIMGTKDMSISANIVQNIAYFYFLLDQPLPELDGKGFYNNSFQYIPEVHPWIVRYVQTWGDFLSTEESWNDEYYVLAKQEQLFGLDMGWYEDSSNWRTFNDFFARYLISPDARPIAYPEDDRIIISPADSVPQGTWRIDENSYITGVEVKNMEFISVNQLISPESPYANSFANGIITHTYLSIIDYHRYHFPISGIIREVRLIPGQASVGGGVRWDADIGEYVFFSPDPDWHSIMTRGLVIVETQDFGYVAVMPIGMSQISSVNFEASVIEGAEVQKGDMLGCFMFGGSTIVILFQEQADFVLTTPGANGVYDHVLMGQEFGRFAE